MLPDRATLASELVSCAACQQSPCARGNRHDRHPARRGSTLLELLVAMAACSTLLVATVKLVGAVLRADRNQRDSLVQGAALNRLSRDFRRDVRAAREWHDADQPDVEGSIARLILDDGRSVEYTVREAWITRTETVAGTSRRERYRLAAGWQARIVQADLKPGRTLALSLVAPSAESTDVDDVPIGKRRDWRVEAVLGADHRWEEGSLDGDAVDDAPGETE